MGVQHQVIIGLLAAIFLIGPISAELYERNCSMNTDGRTLSCYTCMGRDMKNCEHGLTCCSGSCFKLVDREHDMIVKGCTNGDEEDASMKIRTLDMQLYWVNNEKVTGQSFFCKGKDFCNTSPVPLLITSVAIVPLLRYFL
ncbi:unnamed protein product [Cylicocyclus nassatus]|uniref:Uncharacterized protein n=1 Tax=Cylicocyclus nassatus TaxID=53992 RepID=A0AA36H4M3_CYLNA|nr:unnamed protein product [Cylicocyclus nassatus]